MSLAIYNLLLLVFSPLIYLYLLYRRSIGKEDTERWSERWGRYPEAVDGETGRPRLHVHCVSVGELMAAIPVLRELRKRYPEAFLIVTTTTIGGREVALKQVPPADLVVYYPLDFPWVTARALAAIRPDVVALLEWEIWPNFLTEAKRRGAKIVVLNGRISDKGLRRGLRGRFFVASGLAAVDRFCMQSEEDARRAERVGVDPAKVRMLGNTKFDETSTMLTPDERATLRADLGIPPNVPVLVCGSTRPGEEEILAEAVAVLRSSFPDLFVIVAPRHLDRADEAAAPFGPGLRRRSQREDRRATSTLLLDSFGELARVYAVADVAFIGGSLKPFGGQSVFQPLAQGVPAVFGPFMNNQRDIAALAMSEAVGFMVPDAKTLAWVVTRLLKRSGSERQAQAARARGLIERNQGVASRCVDVIAELRGE
ncbi:MAG: glycosyltransferase N-terminal domain-containing protein [Capsulimonadales bacterium]|nr:glycosyltransferase N-terminal domain-containing protein [Capsulimonadales bacterium]